MTNMIPPGSEIIYIFLILLLSIYFIKRGLNSSIPGPIKLPLIGHYFKLRNKPHLRLIELAQKYGNVYSVQIGVNNIIVLNGYTAVKEALFDKSSDFIGRPDFYSFRILGNRGIAFLNASDYWKIGRKEFMKIIVTYSNPRLSFFQDCIKDATNNMIQSFHAANICDPTNIITKAVSHFLLRLCFKDSSEKDIHAFAEMIDVRDFSNGTNPLICIDHFPWLSLILKRVPDVRNLIRRCDLFENFSDKFFQKRKNTFDQNNIQDVMDSFFAICNTSKGAVVLTEFHIVGLIGEFLMAGIDSSITNLRWILLLMTAFPHVQKNVQEEIDMIIGRNRQPTMLDKGMLPYTEATMIEMQRFSSFVFTIMHKTVNNTKVEGVNIPKNSPVLANFYSVNYDPTIWENPHNFDPTRFLNGEKNKIIGKEADKVIVFGTGGRRCAGENLARMAAFHIFTNLMHSCCLQPSPGSDPQQQLKNFQPGLVFTLDPYEIVITKRE